MKGSMQTTRKPGRLVPRSTEESAKIIKTGVGRQKMGDMYVSLLATSWQTLFGLIIVLYLVINLLFALGYLTADGIENARPGSLADAFFFSVQTMSTIGYGKMAPVGLVANLLVTAQVITSFIYFAVIMGLVFSKFSRPTARVLFSNVAVICPYEGRPHFMLRLANHRNNRIVDANIHIVILKKEKTKEGHEMRRFHDLTLVRSRVPILQLSWTAMHIIDEASPLYQVTPEKLHEWDAEILVSLVGLDETLSQTIHARFSYIAEDIICNAAFADIIQRADDEKIIVDYHRFHDVKPLAKAA